MHDPQILIVIFVFLLGAGTALRAAGSAAGYPLLGTVGTVMALAAVVLFVGFAALSILASFFWNPKPLKDNSADPKSDPPPGGA